MGENADSTTAPAVPGIDPGTATEDEKLAWVRARADSEPWEVAIGSVIQDMILMGIPLRPDLVRLGMLAAMNGGERAVRDFTGSLGPGSIDRESPR